MKTHLPVSEAEDTAAILCVEPLASSSSAPLLLLLLDSTVATSSRLFRERWIRRVERRAGCSNASWLSRSPYPSFYCRVTQSVSCLLCPPLPPILSSHILCHSTSRDLFTNQFSSLSPTLHPLWLFLSFFCSCPPSFLSFLPALLSLSYL